MLYIYFEISQTGNLQLLILDGAFTDEELDTQWSEIVQRNLKENGNNQFDKYINNLKMYGKMIAEYELVKLELMSLLLVVDDNSIEFLKSKGYNIKSESGTSYIRSIDAALVKSNSILTRIKMKYNEIVNQLEQASTKISKQVNIEDSIATISSILGFNIGSDLTLSRFNAYQKLAVQKQKALEKNKKRR